ncbi:MAG: signal peptidase II [Clostridiaceae bacterium]|jgi:signal peptidase II|nr:signal peptidase II [Clostridiaceae bacterium]
MLWIIITILVVVIDQATKRIVVSNIGPSEMIPVIDRFFYLTLHRNPGGAWGIFKDSSVLFLVLVPVIAVFLVVAIIRNRDRFLRAVLGLILGGAIGNYIDRLAEGKVIDFLLFYIGSYPFPVFNAADIAVTCGTILLAVYVLFIYKEPKKEEREEERNEE